MQVPRRAVPALLLAAALAALAPPWAGDDPRPQSPTGQGAAAEAEAPSPEGWDLPPLPSSPVRVTKTRFPSGRDKVAVDLFEPAEEGRFPAVVLLHGTHGPRRGEPYYLAMAEDLARHGYVALFVRYYDRGRRGRGNRSQWAESIRYALDYACSLPDVDQERLALVGYSQGAFLALNYGPSDGRLMAVVAYYGGLSPGFFPPAEEVFPPTLLLHGTADRIVPVRRSLETFDWLRQHNKPVDLIVYPGVGHGFTLHERGGWDEVAGADAWSRTLAFLDFHLKYPAWTPEIPPAPPGNASAGKAAPAGGDGGDGLSSEEVNPLAQPPLVNLPFLAEPTSEQGKSFVMVNPAPEKVRELVAKQRIPQNRHHRRGRSHGGSHPSSARGKAPAAHGSAPAKPPSKPAAPPRRR